jgi:2'-5' RNA ligase
VRCFVALVPPASFRVAFETVLLPAMKGMKGWRPLRPEAVHVTLAFMADAEPALVDAAVAAVQAAAAVNALATAPIRLRFGPLKPFPSASRPRVLALEPILGADELAGLWNGFNVLFHREALARGLPPPNPEWSPGARFRPHLSLARPVSRIRHRSGVRPRQGPGALPAGLAASDNLALLDEVFIFDELVLFESILSHDGPRYMPLAHASLTAGA